MLKLIEMDTPIGKLTFDKEIITFNGFNVTTLLRDKQNNPIMMEWLTMKDNVYDVWVIFRVTEETLNGYLDKNIDHIELFKSSNEFHQFYVDDNGENKDFIKKSFDELDQDTLPRVGCFYDPNYSK